MITNQTMMLLHSVAGAAVIGLIAFLQAYVFSGVIPAPPTP